MFLLVVCYVSTFILISFSFLTSTNSLYLKYSYPGTFFIIYLYFILIQLYFNQMFEIVLGLVSNIFELILYLFFYSFGFNLSNFYDFWGDRRCFWDACQYQV